MSEDIECIVVLRSEWDARKARAEAKEAEATKWHGEAMRLHKLCLELSEANKACVAENDRLRAVLEGLAENETRCGEMFMSNPPVCVRARRAKEAVTGGSACHSPEQHMPETTTKGEQKG